MKTVRSIKFILILLMLRNILGANSPRVIIVGAGPAGIAAATKLYENGITNITILEAENRIGGRIYSTNFGDGIVDLGAEFCHGEKNNIVYELAKDYNLLEYNDLILKFYYSSGENVDQSFSCDLFDLFDKIHAEGEKQVNDTISVGEYLTKRCGEEIKSKYENTTEAFTHANELLEFYLNHKTLYDSSFSVFDLSLPTYYQKCEGDDLSWKNGGYRIILDILMKRYPNPDERIPIDETILFNKEVSKIIWENNSDSFQNVECSDKTSYSADYVIFTPSLGVLKHNHNDLFSPKLPENKIKAISKLGIGAISKIYMHFSQRWWFPSNSTNFFPIWTKEDIQLLPKEFPHGPIKNGKSWLLNVVSFIEVGDNNPNVLLAWVGGEFVPQIEQLPDELVIEGLTYLLKKFIGNQYANITKPDSIRRNNWYSNPHFRGTYSYETVESRKEGASQEVILAEPLTSTSGKNVVLFAGEATHPIYYSTVHSAIETGFREAQRIIQDYTSK